MEVILNLTQHAASPEQVGAGVRDFSPARIAKLAELLTFNELPDYNVLIDRANAVLDLALSEIQEFGLVCGKVMLGGAPYFMSHLERVFSNEDITPMYAFSRRESVEVPQADGSVQKTNVFRHLGFVAN